MSAVADVRPALLGHLKDLHLPTVRECYEDTARRAERETLSYEQYLLEVISRECEQRRKSRVQRLLKDSALPLEKSLQNFNLQRFRRKRHGSCGPCWTAAFSTGKRTFWYSVIRGRARAMC